MISIKMGILKRNIIVFLFLIALPAVMMGCDSIDANTSNDTTTGSNNIENSDTSQSTGTTGSDEIGSGSTQEIYSVKTDDNVELKLLRYRPSADASFNEGRQPVLILGGIFMNNDEYLPHTTELMKDIYADMTLPADIADWAEDDDFIKSDPMLYYNLGYYLWKQGFDPWFGNYRGTGRGEMKSESPTNVSNLDVPGCLDMPAMVKKVTDITGLKPVIGGHSTGGLVCWVYLQGAYLDVDEVIKGRSSKPKYIPHVKVDGKLAAERNNSVKGFIAFDPAVCPNLPSSLDAYWIWYIIDAPIVLPLDDMMEKMNENPDSVSMDSTEIISYITNSLYRLGNKYPDSIYQYFTFFNTAEVDPYVLDYFNRYATSNGYLRMIAQYADWGTHLDMREGFNNGPENARKVMPKKRAAGDGYYYYEDHMGNISSPILCLTSEADGMQITERINAYLMDEKTPSDMDVLYEVPGTAHADLPIGYKAPKIIFPMISDWLKKL